MQDLVCPGSCLEEESSAPKSPKQSMFSMTGGYSQDNFYPRYTSRRDNDSVDFAQKYLFNNTPNKDNLEDDSIS